jgi:hypothetical protein
MLFSSERLLEGVADFAATFLNSRFPRCVRVVSFKLLDSGSISPNTKDSEDCTLLQWASINNRSVIVQELLVR